MAIALKRTGGISNAYIKMLTYGEAGSGKTSLIPTLPNVIAISAEGGFLSISDSDIPYIEIKSLADLDEAYQFITESDEAKDFGSIAIDSISEVAEVVLSHEKKKSKDGRAAYGEMADKMATVIRSFRDIPDRHVYMSAKLEKMQDDKGKMIYTSSMPGKNMTKDLPYFFDEVFAMRVETDADGNKWRGLLTSQDGMWVGKDRSGKLDLWEEPDLGAIIKKIQGGK